MEVYLHAFLTSVLSGGEWSALRFGRFTTSERDPGFHGWETKWVLGTSLTGFESSTSQELNLDS